MSRRGLLTTTTGRVVYNRPKHIYTYNDVLRVQRALGTPQTTRDYNAVIALLIYADLRLSYIPFNYIFTTYGCYNFAQVIVPIAQHCISMLRQLGQTDEQIRKLLSI